MTWVDYAVLGIIGVSVLLSVIHGFVRELLSLASWIVSFLVAQYFASQAAAFMPAALQNESVRMLAGFLAVFLMVLIASTLLAIAISGALGAGITNSIVSLTVVFVPQITRVAESVTTGVRNMDFVEAARLRGEGMSWIVFREIAPNILPLSFVYAAIAIGWAIITEASVSFLGFGDPTSVSWGMSA